MKIHQIYTHNNLRNFTYVLELLDNTAIVIDPWDADEIKLFLTDHQLHLKTIINTHEHWDHTQGNESLVSQYNCEVWAHSNGEGKIPCLTRKLVGGELIDIEENEQLKVLNTPGHTFAHLCFVIVSRGVEKAIFTGDTLFNAGVGNCHNGGNAEELYKTIVEQIQPLDDDVLVYPGHDYLENNLQFTLDLEPSNQDAKKWLKKVNVKDYIPGDLMTNIGDERLFNSFMRLDNAEVVENLSLNKPSEKEVFLALRSKRNSW